MRLSVWIGAVLGTGCLRGAAVPGDTADSGPTAPETRGPPREASDSTPPDEARPPPEVSLHVDYDVKELGLSWAGVADLTSQALRVSDGTVWPLPPAQTAIAQPLSVFGTWPHGYTLERCNAAGCTESAPLFPRDGVAGAIGYFKASNPGEEDGFGWRVATCQDGATLAVAAAGEDSAATGVNGDQQDNSARGAGAVYLFGKNPSTGRWRQEAYVKASNAGSFDSFGDSLALSADCDTLAVGAPFEGSLSRGIDPDPGSELAAHAAGAVYVFRRIGGSWNQEAYVKAPNADAMDRFGESVALSGDGSVLAVGAPLEDSAVTGILAEAPLDDDDGILNGAAYVFRRAETGWSEEAFVKGSDTTEVDSFGTTVALSASGQWLAVGAPGRDLTAGENEGSVYVFFDGKVSGWEEAAILAAPFPTANDQLGEQALALDEDGSVLVAGVFREDSPSRGVDSPQNQNGALDSGAVYVWSRVAARWGEPTYLKASNADAGDHFGHAVAIDASGTLIAVTAPGEDGAGAGVSGDPSDGDRENAGAVYLFEQPPGAPWRELAYLKSPRPRLGDRVGQAVALDPAGTTLAVGANKESGGAAGVHTAPLPGGSLDDAGATYLY